MVRFLPTLPLLVWALAAPALAQTCRLSVAGLNRNRAVAGPVNAECPGTPVHSSPFGNWGVSSNFGPKRNGHQFDGWCHDTRVCDNSGSCKTVCADGWYEWNSCTGDPLYRPPNPTLYNANNGTAQVSTTGVNVLGTIQVDVPVSCPVDSDGDGAPDKGGCADVKSYAGPQNFMSLYELDPVCCDDLIQTVYFPATPAPLNCDVWGCGPGGSEWVQPSSYDSPAAPAKVFAEFATAVNWGAFVDSNRMCRVSTTMLAGVSAASFAGPAVAPDSIGTVFGDNLAPVIEQARSVPLPTSLAGASLSITDNAGTRRAVPLFFVSPKQINFLVPAGLRAGPATLQFFRGDVQAMTGRVQIDTVAPGLFTAAYNGQGVAAAVAIRVAPDGTQTSQLVFQCAGPGVCAAVPIDMGGTAEQTFLVLYGTGIRGNTGLTSVSVTIGGEHGRVDYAGAQPQFTGLDQVNVLVPPGLRGRGEVDVVLTVAAKTANTVRVAFR